MEPKTAEQFDFTVQLISNLVQSYGEVSSWDGLRLCSYIGDEMSWLKSDMTKLLSTFEEKINKSLDILNSWNDRGIIFDASYRYFTGTLIGSPLIFYRKDCICPHCGHQVIFGEEINWYDGIDKSDCEGTDKECCCMCSNNKCGEIFYSDISEYYFGDSFKDPIGTYVEKIDEFFSVIKNRKY